MYNGSMDVLGTLEEGACATRRFSKNAVCFKEIECGVYGDLLIRITPKAIFYLLKGHCTYSGLIAGSAEPLEFVREGIAEYLNSGPQCRSGLA